MSDSRGLSPLLAALMARIDAADWTLRRVRLARVAVLETANGRITRDEARDRIVAAGWTAAQARKILDNNIRGIN